MRRLRQKNAQGDLQYAPRDRQPSGTQSGIQRQSEEPTPDPAQGADKIDQDGTIHVQSDESELDATSSEASATSVDTVASSNCDLQERDGAPVVVASDLAAVLGSPDVIQVVLDDIHAPLITIALDEAALAPAVPLLRVPYLERLLEAVRSGTPADRLAEAMRHNRHMIILPHI